jgi:hypothetical protein
MLASVHYVITEPDLISFVASGRAAVILIVNQLYLSIRKRVTLIGDAAVRQKHRFKRGISHAIHRNHRN